MLLQRIHQRPRTRAVTEFRYDEGNPFGRCCFDRKRGFRSVSPIGFGSRTKNPDAMNAAEAKEANAVKKERCERNAVLHLYTGRQKTKYIQECLARKEEPEGKAAARQPGVQAPGPQAVPRVAPLGAGNPPSTSTGSTTPSNAPVAPSAPVTGSAGTATTGSSATSTSGSSGSSIGSSGGR